MRAKQVPIKKAYVWDFDDTLVKTDAKIHVYKNGKKIKSLTSSEYNFYKKSEGEILDSRDFIDADIIMNARKYKMWPLLEYINKIINAGNTNINLFILTARNSKSKIPIYTFLSKEKINIPLKNIITIGSENLGEDSISTKKEKILRTLIEKYDIVYFFDDNEKNIELANKIPRIKTKLIEYNESNIT